MVDLTPSQLEAVEHKEGPLLILAGPGSGKTRVITRRIARLVESGVDPREILAITFTNKAAAEMASRVDALLPGSRVWVSTFHRFCSRLLRMRAEVVGLQPNFTIFDTQDQRQVIKRVLRELNVDAVHYSPSKISALISNAKNDLQTAEVYRQRFSDSVGNHTQAVVARVYPGYQKLLLESNAVDFDDLLLHVVTMLSENPELRQQLDERYRYVLVDEYQDTNVAQYRIVSALSRDLQNLCVTGDPDQSIYGWRGAKIDNILRFEADYPDASVVRLEENFRSTQRILETADSLISHNVYRKRKSLITDNEEGEPVELRTFRDSRNEAESLAAEIRSLVEGGEHNWSDFAVMYRVNALSREVEHALRRSRIPYQVAAGLAFYERAEVKDLLAYLRLIHNPQDQEAFLRIVNRPSRGIGKTTLGRLMAWAGANGFNFMEAAERAAEHPQLAKRAVNALRAFAEMMNELAQSPFDGVAGLIEAVLERTRYDEQWRGSSLEQDLQHLANVEELVSSARQFDEQWGDESTLDAFLETTSLAGETDNLEETGGKVTLLTLHAAKGLEFPVVYVLAVEQNMIPHERSLNAEDPRELEEERRLLFVGMTRAMRKLVLTRTQRREVHGKPMFSIPSQFLLEISPHEVDYVQNSSLGWAEVGEESQDFPAEQTDSSGDDFDQDPVSRPLLTTAADLLNGTGRAVELPIGFAVGMSVRHPRYGLGTVVRVDGFSKRRTVTVAFEQEDHSETFVAEKCPLQPVGLS